MVLADTLIKRYVANGKPFSLQALTFLAGQFRVPIS
jgi:hypothetical protein